MQLNYQVVSFVLLLGLSLVSATGDEEAWRDYKTKFNKTYATEQEEEQRMKIFLDNKHYVETKASSNSFTQGLNSLSDLTTEEINLSRNGFQSPILAELERPLDGVLEALLTAINDTMDSMNETTAVSSDRAWYDNLFSPPTLDWRAQNRVSRVKDQGSCGSCWAFATTGALESILAKRNQSILLSEQNLVDCSRSYGNHGCSGGLMDAALRYVRDHGIMSSHDYPYTGKDGKCKFNRDKSVTRARGSAILPRGNEAFLRLALALHGPLPVAIDASLRSFHSYKSGVYDDRACRSGALNHAVLLVGYGSAAKGGDYWIVKNSWGNSWGDGGYIKMARNRNNLCGIASYAVLPLA